MTLRISDEDNFVERTTTVRVYDANPEINIDSNPTCIDSSGPFELCVPNVIIEGVPEDFTVTVTAGSLTDLVDEDNVVWDFGDGESATGLSVTHTYDDDGAYTITVTATDEDSSSSDSMTINVVDVDPSGNIEVSAIVIDEGESVDFEAFGLAPANPSDPLSGVEWDFGDGTTSTEEIVTHTYQDSGVFEVTLRIFDEDSYSEETVTITVNEIDPVASFTFAPASPSEGQTITFDSTTSTDNPADEITSYEWDFGDGTTSSGAVVTHSYNDNDTYTVTLTVNDEDTSGSTTLDIDVSDVDPSLEIAGSDPRYELEGDLVSFLATGTGSGSSTDTITSITWDFGDGDTATGMSVSHIYEDNGTYTVNLTVEDEDSVIQDSITVIVADLNASGEISVPSTIAYEGDLVSFDSINLVDSPYDEIFTIIWNFGDGTIVGGPGPGHRFSDQGVYTVTLIIWDEDSIFMTSLNITVLDVSPTVSIISNPTTAEEGQEINFSAIISNSPYDNVTSVAWDFGDGNSASGTNVSNTYMSDGTYNVTVTVTDEDNSVTSSILVIITDSSPLANFTFSPENPDANQTVTFTDTTIPSLDLPLSYEWDFNDDGIVDFTSSVIPPMSFAANGSVDIRLTVTDSDGSVSTIVKTMIVGTLPFDTGLLINTTLDSVYYANESTENITGIDYSTIRDSTLTSPLLILYSEINSSIITNSNITDSLIRNSILTNCIVDNSIVKDIVASDCIFIDSFVDPSNLTGSSITGGSTIINSNVTYSDVDNSTVIDSDISWSNITSSYVENTSFSYFNVTNANITNGIIYSGQVSGNGFSYDASTGGSANLTDVINFPPTSVIAVNGFSGTTSTTFDFSGSSSTDPNLGGLLNDSLSYYWTFGDGTNSTSVNISKIFGSEGTYVVNLNVTDSYGLSSISSVTITISNPSTTTSSSSSGGGGGGAGSSTIYLGELNATPTIVNDVDTNERIRFKVNGIQYQFTALNRGSGLIRLNLRESGQTLVVYIDEESTMTLPNEVKIIVKYLEYTSTGSKLSMRRFTSSTITEATSAGLEELGEEINEGVSEEVIDEGDLGSITGAVVGEVPEAKKWVGAVVLVSIVMLGLGLYYGFSRLYKKKK